MTLQDKARAAAEAAGPAFYTPYLERKGATLSALDDAALGRFIRAARKAAKHPGYTMLATGPMHVFNMPKPAAATMTTKALRAELRTLATNLSTITAYEARIRAEIESRG